MNGFDFVAHGPVIGVGAIVGAIAFLPLLLALLPVLRRRADANMVKGMIGVAASFALLLVSVVVVHLLFEGALVPFLVGELAGFFAGWFGIALVVIASA